MLGPPWRVGGLTCSCVGACMSGCGCMSGCRCACISGCGCRNPDNEQGVWCYTVDGPRWEHCDVPLCEAVSTPPPGNPGGLSDAARSGIIAGAPPAPLSFNPTQVTLVILHGVVLCLHGLLGLRE